MGQCTCNFLSYTLGRAVNIEVILPGPVFGQKHPTHRPPANYPVLYLLQGTGYDETAWLRRTSIERYAEERQIAVVTLPTENGRIRRERIDIPFGKIDSLADSPLSDHRKIDWEAFFLQELPEYVCGTFPVSASWEDTYLAGCSDSAEDALRLAREHPNHFAALGLFGGNPSCFEIKRLLEDSDIKQILIASDNGKKVPCDTRVQYKTEPDSWAGYDRAVETLIAALPRKDPYASFPQRRI